MSGLFGALNTANKGLMASQTALHTTGHNISNANTEGFSRQRVELKADLAYNYAGVGQLGTGVKMDSIVRMVDNYVNKQIRQENGTLQEFTAKAEVIEQLEIIFNEPSDTSLNFNIGEMFDAWQELSKNPEMSSAKTIVVEKSKTLTETYNHMLDQIDSLEEENKDMISQNVKSFNATIDKLEALNKQIFNISIKGQSPNDLLDQRDLLLKDLSAISNINTELDDHGRVSISIDKNSVLSAGEAKNKLAYDGQNTLSINGDDITDSIKAGQIKGRLSAQDDLIKAKDDLKTLGENLEEAINGAHGEDNPHIFIYNENGDGKLKVNEELQKDSDLIVPGENSNSPIGDGSRALEISKLRNTEKNKLGDFYNEIITNVGISKQQADNMVANQDILLGQLEFRRETTSGVSIDEEITNLIKFQSAYGANARVISTLTEMLDTLINRTGV